MQLIAIDSYTAFHEIGLQLNAAVVSKDAAIESLAYSQLVKHHKHIQLWAAMSDDATIPLARIIVFYKPSDPATAYWGWYQANDQLNSVLFWEAITKKQHLLGAKQLVGPLLGTTWFEYRYKLTLDAPLVFGEPIHPELYLQQLQQAGFVPWKQFNTAWSNLERVKIKSLAKLADRMQEKGLTFESITTTLEAQHLRAFHHLTTVCFKGNTGFEEIDFEVYQLLMKGLGNSMDRSLSFAFLYEGQPIAYLITQQLLEAPAALNVDKDRCRVLRNFAVSPDFRNQGLGLMLADFFHALCAQKNIHTYIYALMSAAELSDRGAATLLGAQPLASYALFEKAC
jgi:GNAT superfamily N-acetyltransferase